MIPIVEDEMLGKVFEQAMKKVSDWVGCRPVKIDINSRRSLFSIAINITKRYRVAGRPVPGGGESDAQEAARVTAEEAAWVRPRSNNPNHPRRNRCAITPFRPIV